MLVSIFRRSLPACLILLATQAVYAGILTTFVTGDDGGANVIFRVDLDPTIIDSATVTPIITDPAHRLDGIDFVPGTSSREVAVGAQSPGAITRYDVSTDTIKAPFVAATGGATRPSTILSTSAHIHYVENQFGFAGSTHRIMRIPAAGGTPELVFDGAAALPGGASLINFEGLEIFGDRLYFFAKDPTPTAADQRALMSIVLSGGVWDGTTLDEELGGLFGDPSGDGSDELDYDPFSGYLFGTNIRNGEIIAFDPVADTAITSPGALADRFIDASQVGAVGGASGLALLRREVDGIRSDGVGHLVFTALTGVIGAIDIAAVRDFGATNSDVIRLYDSAPAHANTGFSFDDLTPFAAPEPPAPLLLLTAGACLYRLRRKHHSTT